MSMRRHGFLFNYNKINLIILILSILSHIISSSTIRGFKQPNPLVASSGITNNSPCHGLTTKESCQTNTEPCVWCNCAAVPSACYTNDEAKGLPGGVFTCEFTTTTMTTTELPPIVAKEEKKATNKSTKKTFSFVPGVQHTLTDAPVASSFCDPSSPLSLSGYMDVTGSKYDSHGEDKHLFFWFFEKRRSETKPPPETAPTEPTTPLVLWLTGGPGCSSTLALLVENGPCLINDAGDGTVLNPYGWNEVAHVLWLDQPAGVGFSYGEETDKNEKMVGEDAYYFLQSFFQAHPEYLDSPFYVVGESYGGHFAPAIAHRVFQGNEEGKTGTVAINLEGLAVGNGLTDPEVQYQYYAEMAYKNSHHIQTIKEATYKVMTRAIPQCISLIKQCERSRNFVSQDFFCQEALNYCNVFEINPYMATGLNPYNIKLNCDVKPLCYDFSNVDKFLNLNSTREALHVSPDHKKTWYSCDGYVHWQFLNDWMIDMSHNVADLLNGGVKALIYAGDLDFICNYMGNQAWSYDLEWEYGDEFRNATVHEWGVTEEETMMGLARSARGLTFLQVYDAGHMVPMDQPRVALEMMRNFLSGGSF